ncbi:Protein of unknown function [Geodermatophilus obscurus]|jgi:hypothetical protein|uniref:DUF3303 domain-containing protein n=1 Tax=Geodermatophilus obscurus TaxID=1861 RepID=A0A1M7THJ5_9ACTN|nr:DUF3303 family protein [Geodermatophilus obscurus]SHN70078.1 Protein of unknown function [Geodermatophilus obscurus]
MEYVVTWQEQPTGSDAEYRAAQQRVLAAFATGQKPASLTIRQFVARVGLGGYAVVETDEPADLQYFATAYAPSSFTVEPVVHVPDAVLAGTRGAG